MIGDFFWDLMGFHPLSQADEQLIMCATKHETPTRNVNVA
jgi:hypothetical protein